MKQKRLETNIAIVLIAEKKSVVHPEAILLNLTYRKDNLKKKKNLLEKNGGTLGLSLRKICSHVCVTKDAHPQILGSYTCA